MKEGMEKSKMLALDCLDIIIKILKQHKIFSDSEILKRPYGEIKPHLPDKIRIKILNLWYLKIRFLIKKYLIK
jgi:hypothetical protein